MGAPRRIARCQMSPSVMGASAAASARLLRELLGSPARGPLCCGASTGWEAPAPKPAREIGKSPHFGGTTSLGSSPLQQLPVWWQQQLVQQGMGCTASNDLTELVLQRCRVSTTAGALTRSQKASVLALYGSWRVGE